MKVNVEVDCTPDEARRFLGLPDVAPMQQRMLEAMERRMTAAIDGTDTQKLLEQWMPVGAKGMEQMQALWSQLAQSAMGFPGGFPVGGRGKKE